MQEEKGLAKGTFQTHFYGLEFFYYRYLGCVWTPFTRKKVRQPRRQRLPVALAREDCRCLVAALRRPAYRFCCPAMFALGLRIGKAVALPHGWPHRAPQDEGGDAGPGAALCGSELAGESRGQGSGPDRGRAASGHEFALDHLCTTESEQP